jgi:endonuclease/exonuclease/phosphatase family metal-dependent hydrolase
MRFRFSLLSLNVLCGTFFDPIPIKRHLAQIKKIRKINPDILCLQEFNNPYIERIYSNEFCKTHHLIVQRRSNKDYLQKIGIVSMLCVGIVNICSPFLLMFLNPYIHNFIFGNQEIGNVLFVRKDIVTTRTKSNEFKTQSGDFLNLFRKRGYTECVIHDKIHIRNVHLNHQQHLMDTSHGSIQQQVSESFSNLLSTHNIIVGDFNIENVRCPIQFIDCCERLGPTYRKDNPLTYNVKKDKRIDFIFVKDVDVLSKERRTDLESDHDGLLIIFQI